MFELALVADEDLFEPTAASLVAQEPCGFREDEERTIMMDRVQVAANRKWVVPWVRWTGLPLHPLRVGASLDLATFSLFFTTAFLATYAVDAPLRWGLSLVKAAPLIYLRDVGVLLLLLFEILLAARRRKIGKILGFSLLAASFHLALGVLFVGNLVQPLFGLKILLPLFLGIIAGVHIRDSGRKDLFYKILLIIWGVSLSGVLLQALHFPMPWKGFSVEIGDMTIEGNRAWTASGVDRLSGFGRASFDTSLILLLFPATFLFYLRWPLRWGVLLASLVGIVLTTTKVTVLATLGAICLLGILSIRFPLSWAVRLPILVACACLTILPPVLLKPGMLSLNLNDPAIMFAFASFLDRIYNTWPHGYSVIDALPFPFLGRGLGGVGAAQMYFEAGSFNPGDNLYMYTLIATGSFAWLYLGLLFFIGLPRKTNKATRMSFFFVCIIFVLGATMNVIESAAALFLIGYWAIARESGASAGLYPEEPKLGA